MEARFDRSRRLGRSICWQCQELRPVEREDARRQHRPSAQRQQRERQHRPGPRRLGQQSGHRLDRHRAQQPQCSARPGGKAFAGGGKGERQHRSQQCHRAEQHGQRSPGGEIVRRHPAMRIAPQAARAGIEQRQQQHGAPAERVQQPLGDPGAGGAHPVRHHAGGGGGRRAGIGLAVADERQRDEHQRQSQQRRADRLGGLAQRPADRRAPVDIRSVARCRPARHPRCPPVRPSPFGGFADPGLAVKQARRSRPSEAN